MKALVFGALLTQALNAQDTVSPDPGDFSSDTLSSALVISTSPTILDPAAGTDFITSPADISATATDLSISLVDTSSASASLDPLASSPDTPNTDLDLLATLTGGTLDIVEPTATDIAAIVSPSPLDISPSSVDSIVSPGGDLLPTDLPDLILPTDVSDVVPSVSSGGDLLPAGLGVSSLPADFSDTAPSVSFGGDLLPTNLPGFSLPADVSDAVSGVIDSNLPTIIGTDDVILSTMSPSTPDGVRFGSLAPLSPSTADIGTIVNTPVVVGPTVAAPTMIGPIGKTAPSIVFPSVVGPAPSIRASSSLQAPGTPNIVIPLPLTPSIKTSGTRQAIGTPSIEAPLSVIPSVKASGLRQAIGAPSIELPLPVIPSIGASGARQAVGTPSIVVPLPLGRPAGTAASKGFGGLSYPEPTNLNKQHIGPPGWDNEDNGVYDGEEFGYGGKKGTGKGPSPTPDDNDDCPDSCWDEDSDDDDYESPTYGKQKKNMKRQAVPASGGFRGFSWPAKQGDAESPSEPASPIASASPSAQFSGAGKGPAPGNGKSPKGKTPQGKTPQGKDPKGKGGNGKGAALYNEGYPYAENTPYGYDSPYDQNDDYEDHGADDLPDWLKDLQGGKSPKKGKKKAKKMKGTCPRKCKGKGKGKPTPTGKSYGTTTKSPGYSPTSKHWYSSKTKRPWSSTGGTPYTPTGPGYGEYTPTESPWPSTSGDGYGYGDETPPVSSEVAPVPTTLATTPIEYSVPGAQSSEAAPPPYEYQPGPEGSNEGAPYTGDTLAGLCPKTCNPFNPAENFCDSQTTGCVTTGGSKYYCTCRAGYRYDGVNPKDFSVQFKVPGQPYVYGPIGKSCNTRCDDDLCNEVMVRAQCV